jgi:hypothetical protein
MPGIVTDQEVQDLLKECDELVAETEAAYQAALKGTQRYPPDLRKLTLLICGDYYSPTKSVLVSEEDSYDKKDMFDALRREQAPTATERLQSIRRPSSYTATLQKSIPSRLHRLASNDSSSLDVETKKAMFPTDILGIPYRGSHMTHLIPASNARASAYSDVVRCVLGLGDDARNDIQQAIHGTQRRTPRAARIPCTGAKHSPLNLARIFGQGTYFEEEPCVIIVPIMTLEQMKSWNLEGYEAIVLAGDFETATAADAYTSMRMNQVQTLTLATQGEIKQSCESLKRAVQGLAYSLAHRRSQRREDLLEAAARQQLESFRANLQLKGKVIVPKAAIVDYSNLRVGKVSLQAHSPEAGAVLTHPAPDPLLLVIKSAINWSRLNGQQLLVTGEGSEEDEEMEDPMEEIEESFVETMTIGRSQPNDHHED